MYPKYDLQKRGKNLITFYIYEQNHWISSFISSESALRLGVDKKSSKKLSALA